MSSRVSRLFVAFVVAMVLVLVSLFIGYRCGFSEGRRIAYTADISAAIRDNTDFKLYVDSLYIATYRNVLDSVVRTDKMVGVMFDWMQGRPGCGMSKKEPTMKKPSGSDFDKVFMKRN